MARRHATFGDTADPFDYGYEVGYGSVGKALNESPTCLGLAARAKAIQARYQKFISGLTKDKTLPPAFAARYERGLAEGMQKALAESRCVEGVDLPPVPYDVTEARKAAGQGRAFIYKRDRREAGLQPEHSDPWAERIVYDAAGKPHKWSGPLPLAPTKRWQAGLDRTPVQEERKPSWKRSEFQDPESQAELVAMREAEAERTRRAQQQGWIWADDLYRSELVIDLAEERKAQRGVKKPPRIQTADEPSLVSEGKRRTQPEKTERHVDTVDEEAVETPRPVDPQTEKQIRAMFDLLPAHQQVKVNALEDQGQQVALITRYAQERLAILKLKDDIIKFALTPAQAGELRTLQEPAYYEKLNDFVYDWLGSPQCRGKNRQDFCDVLEAALPKQDRLSRLAQLQKAKQVVAVQPTESPVLVKDSRRIVTVPAPAVAVSPVIPAAQQLSPRRKPLDTSGSLKCVKGSTTVFRTRAEGCPPGFTESVIGARPTEETPERSFEGWCFCPRKRNILKRRH